MTQDRRSFILGEDYRELSPKEGKNRYRWVTLRPVFLEFDYCVAPNCIVQFYDNHHKLWLTITNNTGRIEKDYAWNGNTPKVHVPILGWIGTPDHKKTRKPSLWHDVLCQMIKTEHMPLNKFQADAVFYDLLAIEKYIFTSIFHGAVRRLGPLYEEKENTVYSTLTLIPA